MSKIEYTNDNKVISRRGEFYGGVDSCHTTPRSLKVNEIFNDPIFTTIEIDLDELMNKPRRFFDRLLSIAEYKREAAPEHHREYWNHIIRGCELWLSAVNNGLYEQAILLAEPLEEEGKKLRKEVERIHNAPQ